MLQRINELLLADKTFSIETTLSTRSYINLVRKAQARGYEVRLLFFWLKTPELAKQRVAERVQNGGHNIPEDVIKRRYVLGIKNLFNIFIPDVDYWAIYDNSDTPRKIIAYGEKEQRCEIKEELLYNTIKSYVK